MYENRKKMFQKKSRVYNYTLDSTIIKVNYLLAV
jgi:hypothetical protein